jgi:hypothetical protein
MAAFNLSDDPFADSDSLGAFRLPSDTPRWRDPPDQSAKHPPEPRERLPLVERISTSRFPPFTHFFISISQAHLFGPDQSFFLRIRIHPAIPIVETPPVWCLRHEADFRAAYAFDFTQIPPFQIDSFIPTVELFTRVGSRPRLNAVIVLPLKVSEIVECVESHLTFSYRHRSVDVHSLRSHKRIGTIIVTAAFGLAEHAPFLDPASHLLTTRKVHPSETRLVKPLVPKIEVTQISERRPVPPPLPPAPPPRPRRRHRRHRHRTGDYNWVDEAIHLGWRPPGVPDIEWRQKARSRGWSPAHEFGVSSIGVECDPNQPGIRDSRPIQTEYPVFDSDSDEYGQVLRHFARENLGYCH